MEEARLQRQLRAVDWDFQEPIHGVLGGIHWYPASFPASLPSTLISLLSRPGDLVLDPYAGSGAVGAESIRQGRRAAMCDANPVAVTSSWSLLALLTLRIQDRIAFEEAVIFTHEWLVRQNAKAIGQSELSFSVAEPKGIDERIERWLGPAPQHMWNDIVVGQPVWRALSPWFHHDTLTSLENSYVAMRELRSKTLQCFLLTAMSAVLRGASSQNQSWGHIADNVLPKIQLRKNPLQQMRRWWTFVSNRVLGSDLPVKVLATKKSYVHLVDWTKKKRPRLQECALLLTSPPYANAIDYFRSQRLSLYLMGHDEAAVDVLAAGEIGARRKRFRPESVETWASELEAALRIQVAKVKAGGTVALILPHRAHPHADHIDEMLERLFELGWKRLPALERTIHQFRTRQSWTSIKKESITIFTQR